MIGGKRAAWFLFFTLLCFALGSNNAQSVEDTNGPSSGENQDVPDGESSGFSAGGWFSIGGWSSSWKTMVSGTRSMFRWRFGNASPESGEDSEVTAENATETTASGRRCEQLTIDMCQGMGYDSTSMPNLLNHESQDIASIELTPFGPLVRTNCSSDMRFFLCALYAPKCSENVGGGEQLIPCRSVCERIKSSCDVVMERFEFEWPSIFECDKYPEPLQAHCTGQ